MFFAGFLRIFFAVSARVRHWVSPPAHLLKNDFRGEGSKLAYAARRIKTRRPYVVSARRNIIR
jgi:hypothetical protein